ncbi:MAG: MFS transporter [Actinomycetota bacterium]
MSRSGLGVSFWRFWWGSAVSQLGDGVRITALPLLAASITRDPLPVAVVGAAVWLPWLVFGVVGGAIVDRVDRRSLMRNVQLARMLVMAVVVAAVVTDLASIPLLAGAAFVIGLGEVLVDSALYSVVPRVVAEAQLEAANGRLGAAQLVGNELAGPPVGALLFGATAWLPFAADAVSFGASGVALERVRGDFRPDDEGRPRTSIRQDAREGVRWLAGHRVLRAITLGLGAINVGAGGWAVLVLFALEVLDVTGVGFGLLVSSTAIGGVVGSFSGERVARVLGRRRAMLWPLAITGLATMGVGLTSNAFVAGVFIFVEGLGVGIFNVIGRSLRQVLTPDRLLGRVTSGQRMFSYGMGAIGALLGGWLADTFGLRTPFIVGGALIAIVAALMGFWVTDRVVEEARSQVTPR